jgi:hypothetical protein
MNQFWPINLPFSFPVIWAAQLFVTAMNLIFRRKYRFTQKAKLFTPLNKLKLRPKLMRTLTLSAKIVTLRVN